MIFRGKITEISKISTGEKNGKEWASLDFEVTEDNPQNELYPQIGSFSFFKNGEYVSYAKDFNNNYKIGDVVDVEFNFKRINYKKDGEDRKFYKTECWKITGANNTETALKHAAEKINKEFEPAEDGLPF